MKKKERLIFQRLAAQLRMLMAILTRLLEEEEGEGGRNRLRLV